MVPVCRVFYCTQSEPCIKTWTGGFPVQSRSPEVGVRGQRGVSFSRLPRRGLAPSPQPQRRFAVQNLGGITAAALVDAWLSHLTGAELAGHCCHVQVLLLPPAPLLPAAFCGVQRARKSQKTQGLSGFATCDWLLRSLFCEPAAGHSRLLLWEPRPRGPGVLLSPPAVGGCLLCVLPSLNLRVCPCLPARFPSVFPGPRGP